MLRGRPIEYEFSREWLSAREGGCGTGRHCNRRAVLPIARTSRKFSGISHGGAGRVAEGSRLPVSTQGTRTHRTCARVHKSGAPHHNAFSVNRDRYRSRPEGRLSKTCQAHVRAHALTCRDGRNAARVGGDAEAAESHAISAERKVHDVRRVRLGPECRREKFGLAAQAPALRRIEPGGRLAAPP